MKKIKDHILFIAAALSVVSAGTGCSSRANNLAAEKHQAAVNSPGSGMIYIDKVDCKRVMEENGQPAVFHCYQVGFIDSMVIAKAVDKKDVEAGKYFQYDMQYDWVALSNGDSLQPVFFEPKLRIERHRSEGILVFESVNGKAPDTLIYNDSFGSWGTQQFIISSSKK